MKFSLSVVALTLLSLLCNTPVSIGVPLGVVHTMHSMAHKNFILIFICLYFQNVVLNWLQMNGE